MGAGFLFRWKLGRIIGGQARQVNRDFGGGKVLTTSARLC
jgi:hypothetical protein